MEQFHIRRAESTDLPEILGVQRRAFSRVAAAYDIAPEALPPLVETLENLIRLRAAHTRFFVAVTGSGRIVGTVRGSRTDGLVEIGRLAVDDDWLRRGVATELMRSLEASYPQATLFSVFTGEGAIDALSLYTGLGYEIVRREELPQFVLVWLEKPGPGASQ